MITLVHVKKKELTLFMANKLNVGIIFGGKSAEHEVSLLSAKNVYEAIDKEKYNPILIGISKSGQWLLGDDSRFLLAASSIDNQSGKAIALAPQSNGLITNFSDNNLQTKIDVVFPVLHGPFGEDGTVQGLLKLANIPFVGAGVLGSAVGMDKDVMKRLLRDAGLPIGKFLSLKSTDEKTDYRTIADALDEPFFIKPANMGSSVGISKVHNPSEYSAAIELAFKYDTKLIIEEYIKGREFECAVLGNNQPIASLVGEVIPQHEFYSYEAKYLDENGAILEIPAKIDSETADKFKELAIKTFQSLACEGLGRVDFFLTDNGGIIINEINTIPGFTSISMYPKLWKASGISYTELIDRLIQLALERFEREQKLQTSHKTS